MALSHEEGPHFLLKRPFSKSDVSCQPDENWGLILPMRCWVAKVARVRDAAELTVETIEVECQSSASVTICQIFSVDSLTDSIRAAWGRRSQAPVWGSLKPGSSPEPSCDNERSTVSG